MRWFFLIVLVLFATVTNMAVFETLSGSRAMAGLALNIVAASIFGFWTCAYWLNGRRQDIGFKYALSLFFLGCALALCQHSLELAIANECPSVRESGRARLLTWIFNEVIVAGYCKPVLVAYFLTGVSFLAISARTFYQARRM